MSQYGGTVTVKGRNLVSGLIAGEELEITKVVVGSGTVPDGTDLSSMEALVAPVADATGSAPLVTDGVVSMTVEYRNDMNGGLAEDFKLSEFGIFAKKVGSGEEVLLYYAYLGDSAQPVNAYQTDRVDTKRYLVTIDLAIDPDVQIIYSPDAFVAGQMIADHIMDPDAHGGISARVGAVEKALDGKAKKGHAAEHRVSGDDPLTPEDLGASPKDHKHSADDITSGTIPVARGGTGINSNPEILVNLGGGSAADVFTKNPRPGVYGTLPVANGGTGNTSVDTVPTSESTKMVTSGGVHKALAEKANTSHTHAASGIKAGTFAETGVKAKSGTDYGTARVRNIYAGTTDMEAGVTALESGAIYFVYE